jgi:hypothetical protein
LLGVYRTGYSLYGDNGFAYNDSMDYFFIKYQDHREFCAGGIGHEAVFNVRQMDYSSNGTVAIAIDFVYFCALKSHQRVQLRGQLRANSNIPIRSDYCYRYIDESLGDHSVTDTPTTRDEPTRELTSNPTTTLQPPNSTVAPIDSPSIPPSATDTPTTTAPPNPTSTSTAPVTPSPVSSVPESTGAPWWLYKVVLPVVCIVPLLVVIACLVVFYQGFEKKGGFSQLLSDDLGIIFLVLMMMMMMLLLLL